MLTKQDIADLRERLQEQRIELLQDIEAREELHATDHEHIVAASRQAPAPEIIFKSPRQRQQRQRQRDRQRQRQRHRRSGAVHRRAARRPCRGVRRAARRIPRCAQRAAAPVREEIAELRGALDALMTLIGNSNKARSVGRKRSTKLLAPPA